MEVLLFIGMSRIANASVMRKLCFSSQDRGEQRKVDIFFMFYFFLTPVVFSLF